MYNAVINEKGLQLAEKFINLWTREENIGWASSVELREMIRYLVNTQIDNSYHVYINIPANYCKNGTSELLKLYNREHYDLIKEVIL